jgi:hypothetical protein
MRANRAGQKQAEDEANRCPHRRAGVAGLAAARAGIAKSKFYTTGIVTALRACGVLVGRIAPRG